MQSSVATVMGGVELAQPISPHLARSLLANIHSGARYTHPASTPVTLHDDLKEVSSLYASFLLLGPHARLLLAHTRTA